jgi:hypothetical protein
MAILIKYWKPLAVLILLIAVWMHGHNSGSEHMDAKWQAIFSKQQLQAANARLAASEAARDQEQKWAAAFDAAASISHEEMKNVQAHRDRLLADLRSGRVRLQACPAAKVPAVAADSGKSPESSDSGQSAMAGELVNRLAVCDEVTLERNQAVELLRAERL